MRRLAHVAALVVCAALLPNCASSNTEDGGNGSDSGTACVDPNGLNLYFSPMYSAFEPAHVYQIPVVTDGINALDVKWSVDNPSMVELAFDPDTQGAMITVLDAGTVTVSANAAGLCGSSTLNITAATTDDWNVGNARYNDGVVLRHCGFHMSCDGGMDAGPPPQQAACTNCHGPNSMGGPYSDVSHTPEQAGGFSDQDLINIFTMGIVPDGGYFDSSIVPYDQWQQFHQWAMQGDEAQGVVVYLRSLTPAPQNGTSNFGGHHRPDGGGFGPPNDGGTDGG